MRYCSLLQVFLILSFSNQMQAQNRSSAQFAFGQDSLIKFLNSNIQYPPQTLEQFIEGTVEVSFAVDTAGQISNYEVIAGLGEACNVEVIRAIHLTSGDWMPAIIDNQLVQSTTKQKVRFLITDDPNTEIDMSIPTILAFIMTVDPSVPQNEDGTIDHAKVFFDQAKAHYDSKEYYQAVKMFTKCLRQNKEHTLALYYRALAYEKTNKPDKACSDMERCAQLGHKNAQLYLENNCNSK